MTVDTRLEPDDAIEHLRDADALPPDADASVTPLGGGVSNAVLQVTWKDGCAVLKRPLANLAVEDHWPADVGRVHNEAAAARLYRTVGRRTPESGVRIPEILLEDEDDHVVGMACAPREAATWKTELLEGRVDVAVAEELGRFLGAVHRSAAESEEWRRRLGDGPAFDQLRLDPYHRTVAERHPDLAAPIRREVERIEAAETTLVHGDFSPKNVLVERGEDGPVPWLIDFEVAHWGDPAFDVAFLLNHLLIKSVFDSTRQGAYLEAARRFWHAYDDRVEWDVETGTVRELGVLLLARVDGKSPVEYLERASTEDAIRRSAGRILREGSTDLEAAVAVLEEETPQ